MIRSSIRMSSDCSSIAESTGSSVLMFLRLVIITEMVLVFSGMEHELNMETPEFSAQVARLSQLDISWVASINAGSGLGLQSTSHSPAWLGNSL